MKSYSEEITIDKPLPEVVRLFTAIEYFPEWQPDLQEYQTFRGTPLEEGAKTRLVYREAKNDTVKMVETILENNLPSNIKFKHSTDGVISYQNHIFSETEDGTLYRVDSEYDVDGLMKILNILSPNHFPKQTRRFMESFKEFAEKQ